MPSQMADLQHFRHLVSTFSMFATCGGPVCIPKAAAPAMDFGAEVSLFGRYFAKYGAE